MTESETNPSPEQQVKAASKAFEQEFERFARFIANSSAPPQENKSRMIAE